MSFDTLTMDQQTAASHFEGPALTLAIPGSGKTTLLIYRLIHLVEKYDVAPETILTLTFSKASAEDMKSRYRTISESGCDYGFTFMTIHKFAFGIYKLYSEKTGRQMRLIDEGGEKYRILSGIFRKHQVEKLNEDEFETLSSQIGLIYNLKLKREDTDLKRFEWDNIFEMAEDYHRYKRTHNCFDFDDMLLDAIKILRKNPALLESVQKRYSFIQVDEAQDTSKLQYELIELIAGERNNLFLVADDDQSIYGFRGAYPDYLLDFPKRHLTAKLYHLSINFRSDANIVKTAEGLIGINVNRYDKPMNAIKPAEQKPTVILFEDLYKRNSYIVSSILKDSSERAILYRNKVSALSIMDTLSRNGIAFDIKDPPMNELNHWMLGDLLAFFNLMLIPQDLESFTRIAFKMNGFISREMLDHIRSNHRGRDVFSILVDIPFLQDYQTRTQERLRSQFQELSGLRPFDAIHYIETELGYLDHLKQNTERHGMTMHFARTRLDAYKAIAKPLKTAFDFITRIDALKTILGDSNNSGSSITLSTIHGSKGLEFENVSMIDVNPKTFPGFKATENDALEEERRLFYVGLTRAKSSFELLHVEFVNGSFNPNSKFIDELVGQPLTDHLFDHITGKPATG
jgi:DNA helicase-2/ATP-dependent DNA helicase PcrA